MTSEHPRKALRKIEDRARKRRQVTNKRYLEPYSRPCSNLHQQDQLGWAGTTLPPIPLEPVAGIPCRIYLPPSHSEQNRLQLPLICQSLTCHRPTIIGISTTSRPLAVRVTEGTRTLLTAIIYFLYYILPINTHLSHALYL